MVSAVRRFSDMVTEPCVCQSKTTQKVLHPGLDLYSFHSLYLFAAMQDRLLELAMEVLQHRLQIDLVERGSGLRGVALSAVSEQAVG